MPWEARTYAQVVGATLSGTIKDASGASVPGAQVSVKNVATGTVRELTADSAGFYSVPNLLPGDYEVTFSATGFTTEVASGITLTVGAEQVLNASMRVGQISQKVVVTEQAPIVELASSAITGQVTASTVRELPLNGRSWTDLAALSPGVDAIQTQPTFSQGSDRGNRGFGQQLTISGARPQQNNYRLDGVSLNDYANGAPGSVMGGNLGVDAIQEFSVITSNYSAEYGKTSGGVVNAVTRSGTNAFHGSGYEFFRNSKLDAANFFEAGQRSPFKRNQFGGAAGGPIIKNRTFFFADYEGIRQSKGVPYSDFVPSNNARLGILNGGTAANQSGPCTNSWNTSGTPDGHYLSPQASVCVNDNAAKYLALYPTSSVIHTNPDGSPNPDLADFTFSGQQIVNENFVTTRIDHKFSDKDSLFGTYLFDKTPYNSPDSFRNVGLDTLSERHVVAAEETHTFSPSFVNAIRFGFQHERVDDNQGLTALNPAAGDPSFGVGGPFGTRNAAYVHFGGGATDMPGGTGGLSTFFYRWNSYQVYDDAFVTRGTHSIKFGVAVERMLDNVQSYGDPNGQWYFPSLQDFLTNTTPDKFQGGVASQSTPRNIHQTDFGAYLQDDWRIRPSLTLNLGLRYEMVTVPTETAGKLINLRNITDPYPVCGKVATFPNGNQACSGAGALFTSNPTLRNFEPRIGFAWDPLHNGKMAIRGGAGLFDVLPLPYQFNLMETGSSPFALYATLLKPGSGTFYTGVPSTLPLRKARSTYIESSPHRNYVSQWNLNAQYQLTPNLAAMVAYVGSRAVHMPYRVDESDLSIPEMTPLGYIWQPGGNGTLINTNFGSIRGMFYQGRSYYNALEAQVSKRMSHGLQVQGVFTWAKSMDTSSATVAGDAFGNSISSLDWFDPKLTRGLSDFNVGRTLVLNGTWDVPSPKSLSGFARWPLDGWELGMIFTVGDGIPFTATWGTGSDPASTLSGDDFAFPNRLGGSGCNTLTNPGNPSNYIKTQCFSVPTVPDMATYSSIGGPGYGCDPAFAFPQCVNLRGNAGRNILIGPGLTELDFSVFKNNYMKRVSETFNAQFRAEFFNIMNHANFRPPLTGDGNNDIFDGSGNPSSSAGVLIAPTATTSREIQFALKFIW